MPASSLREKPGTSSMMPGELALAEHDELHVGLGDDGRVAGRLVEQRELAERRPGRGSRSCGPGGSTLAVPSRITKNSCPVSPSVTRTLPAGTRTSSARRATSWRSLREQALKRDTSLEVVDEGVATSHRPRN